VTRGFGGFLQSGTPPLDPDRRNDHSPPIAGPNGQIIVNPVQPVTICATNWTVSEQAQNGEFNKLRCGP